MRSRFCFAVQAKILIVPQWERRLQRRTFLGSLPYCSQRSLLSLQLHSRALSKQPQDLPWTRPVTSQCVVLVWLTLLLHYVQLQSRLVCFLCSRSRSLFTRGCTRALGQRAVVSVFVGQLGWC